MAIPVTQSVGVVAIGRNEGERLKRCLASLAGRCAGVVYVDSGSTDASVAHARSVGVEVVEIDTSVPFTAARARNAGYKRLLELHPQLAYVQFVDGDCEVVAGWLELAAGTLDERSELSVVCGRRRERFPEATRYNKLCDIEWDSPVGEADACGGDAMFRAEALCRAGGFNPTLIAGEEPELCWRIRGNGGKVYRLDAEMTLHDAAVTRFSQWWRRSVRGGHAFMEHLWMHGRADRVAAKQVRSMAFWAIGVPALVIALAWPTRGISAVLLLGYVALYLKIRRGQRRRGLNASDAHLYAWTTVVWKFAGVRGAAQFLWRRLTGRKATLIEYKGTTATTA